MFKKNQSKLSGNSITVIGESKHIKGSLRGSSEIWIQGKVDGDVKATESLFVGINASIIGDIYAKNITNDGKVQGDKTVKELLTLGCNSGINGNIQASIMNIQKGANFSGLCEMGRYKELTEADLKQ